MRYLSVLHVSISSFCCWCCYKDCFPPPGLFEECGSRTEHGQTSVGQRMHPKALEPPPRSCHRKRPPPRSGPTRSYPQSGRREANYQQYLYCFARARAAVHLGSWLAIKRDNSRKLLSCRVQLRRQFYNCTQRCIEDYM